MWGYDGLASSVCQPALCSRGNLLTIQIVLAVLKFREDYGQLATTDGKQDWVIPAIWQLALGAGSLIGLLLGGAGAGLIAKKYGRQLCMALSYSKPHSLRTISSEAN
jgi:hypothetical protein